MSRIYASRSASARTDRQQGTEGTSILSPCWANDPSKLPLPIPDEYEGGFAEVCERLEHLDSGEDWVAGLEDGVSPRGMYATCTTFGSPLQEPENKAYNSLSEDEQVVDFSELERLEKSIFVKAALQLLLDKIGAAGCGASNIANMENTSVGFGNNSGGGTPVSGRPARTSLSMAAADDALPTTLLPFSPSFPVLKAGLLRKANHHAMGAIWNNKLVEVHKGLFVYEGDEKSPKGRRRKSLPLHASICTCQPATSKSTVFELVLKKGAKRLWMCSNEDERNDWVHVINSAMIVLPAQGGRGTGGSIGGAQAIDPSSPHASDMLRYRDMRLAMEVADDRDNYLHAVAILLENGELCVPFPWIRRQIFPSQPEQATTNAISSFLPFYLKYARKRARQAQQPNHGGACVASPHSQSQQASGSNGGELTQLWKDMMRDKVCINGQIIHGEYGPEAILGALARVLTTLALQAKAHEETSKSLGLEAATPSTSGSARADKKQPDQHRLSSSVSQLALARIPSSSLGSLNEVQIVAHTMEILLACNRTQSGGDTYYCVEYLFRNPNLAVVCPYSSHAEPLQISLELVEEDSVHRVVSPCRTRPPPNPTEFSFGAGAQSPVPWRISGVSRPASVSSTSESCPRADSLPAIFSQEGHQSSRSAPDSEQLPHPDATGATPHGPRAPLSAPAAGGRFPYQGHFYDFESSTSSSLAENIGLSLVTGRYQSRHEAKNLKAEGNDLASTSEDTGTPRSRRALRRPVILVKIQANTAYKVCPLDPQDGDDSDIWSLVSARFEQHFIVSGVGLSKSDEFIRLKTMTVNHRPTSVEGGGEGEGEDSGHAFSQEDPSRPRSAPRQLSENVGSQPPLTSSDKTSGLPSVTLASRQQPERQMVGKEAPPDGAT